MDLFEIIPANLFSILNSKNKDVYVNSLFLLRKVFKQNLIIDKNVLVKELATVLAKELLKMDIEDEQATSGVKINKNATSLAHFVIRKLTETGWIELEYGLDTSFKEHFALPPYSVKLINVLHSIVKDDEAGYNSYMYSIYSNLIQADSERKDFRYAALLNAYNKTGDLETELKTLYHNIRRRFNKLSLMTSVNEVLEDHFDEYQRKVIKQVYLPLKTKDSLNRFKGSIVRILQSWMRNTESLEGIQKQALAFHNFKDVDEANQDILEKIYFIVDKLNELEDTIEKIDAKNNDYVSATTEKMHFLLTNDSSVKAKLSRLLDKFSTDPDLAEDLHEHIYFERQGYINEDSLFIRSYSREIFDNIPMEIDFSEASQYVDDVADSILNDKSASFSHQNVLAYVETKMINQNKISSDALDIKDDYELILAIHSLMKGFDKKVFYKIELSEGSYESNNYLIPKMDYVRRRKLKDVDWTL